MPCWTRTTVNVDLGKINVERLIEALEAMGLNPRATIEGQMVRFRRTDHSVVKRAVGENDIIFFEGGTYQKASGRLTLTGYGASEEKGKEIKQRYSLEVAKHHAMKAGWSFRETGKNKFQLVKR